MNAPADTSRRRRIWEKCQGTCPYCGCELPFCSNWEIEHVVPRCVGGSNQDGNLVIACSRCNQLKAGRSASQFQAGLEEQIGERLDELEELFARYVRGSDFQDSFGELAGMLRERWGKGGRVRFARGSLLGVIERKASTE